MKSLLEALKERKQDKEKALQIDKNDLLGFLRRRNAEQKARMEREKLLQHLGGRR